jgi:hypothetical protein
MGLTMGPDGNMWTSLGSGSYVERIVGSITNSFLVSGAGIPRILAAGPDGNVWFTEGDGSTSIGVVTTAPPPGIAVVPGSGPPGTRVTVTGSGFGSLDRVTLLFLDTDHHRKVQLAVVGADGLGGFTQIVRIPRKALPGSDEIRAVARSLLKASVPFTVTGDGEPRLSPD